MKKLIIILAIVFMASTAWGSDKDMSWNAASGADGYKIYMSTDNGSTWDSGVDVGNVTTYTYTNIPETGLILFRISSYNGQGEIIRYNDGIWYNYLLNPPGLPSGYGME